MYPCWYESQWEIKIKKKIDIFQYEVVATKKTIDQVTEPMLQSCE